MATTAETRYRYIEIDDKGRPIIAGSRFKVALLISFWQASNATPAQLHEQFPILSLAQIHSAFAYYWDHKDEIEQAIAASDQLEDELRRIVSSPPSLDKFLQRKTQLQG